MVALESMLPPPPDGDARVVLGGVSFEEYQRLAAARGESASPRMVYLEGRLELMVVGKPHEGDKKKLARLIEAYADHLGLPLEGFGSWTIQRAEAARGAEADECYVVGREVADDGCPDFAVEVVYTSGGLSKLDVWGGLGVTEVWLWSGRRLVIYQQHELGWAVAARSRFAPDIDPALVEACMAEPTQTAAAGALRAALRG